MDGHPAGARFTVHGTWRLAHRTNPETARQTCRPHAGEVRRAHDSGDVGGTRARCGGAGQAPARVVPHGGTGERGSDRRALRVEAHPPPGLRLCAVPGRNHAAVGRIRRVQSRREERRGPALLGASADREGPQGRDRRRHRVPWQRWNNALPPRLPRRFLPRHRRVPRSDHPGLGGVQRTAGRKEAARRDAATRPRAHAAVLPEGPDQRRHGSRAETGESRSDAGRDAA